MQTNSSDTISKLCRSPENAIQQQAAATSSGQFPRATNNPRFAITPESMAMNLRSDTPTPGREQQPHPQPQPQHETPLVEVKSYFERYNKAPTATMENEKLAANTSFYRSFSDAATNSQACTKTDTSRQPLLHRAHSKNEFSDNSPSPSSSPKTPSQQWNFETATNNECSLTVMGQQQQHKYRSGSDVSLDDPARLNFKYINDLYAKRIEDIDVNAWGDKDLKIFTYQEWVEVLTKISESFIANMEDLEREVAGHLELVQKRVVSSCRHSQENELLKYRKDINTLIKYIKNARSGNNWDQQGLTFETISPAVLFDLGDVDNLTIEGNRGDDIKNYNDADVAQKSKLYANMKALAHEVAEKHDEVRELKRQIICLEDEIQKAQKKIQLKDDVIRELRNDLKCVNNKISSNPSLEAGLPSMSPINFQNETSRSANTQMTDNTATFQMVNESQFDSLSHTEVEEQQKIKLLDEEINEFFEMNHVLNKQQMDYHRKRIREIMDKLESEKAAAYRKLDFIRRQLIDLESVATEGSNDCDSGFLSKSENDQDAKILEAVRKRLRGLNEANCEMKKKIQKLEFENNELTNNFKTDKSFSQRNSNILKEIADLLCNLRSKQFSYAEIHTAPSQVNPFCEAILEMQKEFQEKESQLLKALGNRNKQNEELSQLLIQNEKNFNQEREVRLLNNFEDTDNTPATLLPTTSQPLPVTTTTTPSA